MKEKIKKLLNKKINLLIILLVILIGTLIGMKLDSNRNLKFLDTLNIENCINESKEFTDKEFTEKDYKEFTKKLKKASKDEYIETKDNTITASAKIEEFNTLFREKCFEFSNNKLISYKERLVTTNFDNCFEEVEAVKKKYLKVKEELFFKYGEPEIRDGKSITNKVYYWPNENIEIPVIEEVKSIPYEDTWSNAYIKIYL